MADDIIAIVELYLGLALSSYLNLSLAFLTILSKLTLLGEIIASNMKNLELWLENPRSPLSSI